MSIAEGDLSRALNALSATLNDQSVESVEPERIQQIVTGALGGEEHLRVTTEGEPADGAALLDPDGRRVARIKRADGSWTTERIVDAQIADTQVPTPPPPPSKIEQVQETAASEAKLPLPAALGTAAVVFVVLFVILSVTLWVSIVAAVVAALAVGGALHARSG